MSDFGRQRWHHPALTWRGEQQIIITSIYHAMELLLPGIIIVCFYSDLINVEHLSGSPSLPTGVHWHLGRSGHRYADSGRWDCILQVMLAQNAHILQISISISIIIRKQGGISRQPFVHRKKSNQSFRRAHVCKFSRQKRSLCKFSQQKRHICKFLQQKCLRKHEAFRCNLYESILESA